MVRTHTSATMVPPAVSDFNPAVVIRHFKSLQIITDGFSDPWQTPANLGPKVNGSTDDSYPRISLDGRTLYFCSNRSGNWDNYWAPIIPIVDFNGDGIVDLKDFSRLAQYWGQNESSVDIGPMAWGDGRVDIHDVAVLAEHWLTGF